MFEPRSTERRCQVAILVIAFVNPSNKAKVLFFSQGGTGNRHKAEENSREKGMSVNLSLSLFLLVGVPQRQERSRD